MLLRMPVDMSLGAISTLQSQGNRLDLVDFQHLFNAVSTDAEE